MTPIENGMIWILAGIVAYLFYRIERLTYEVEQQLKEKR